MFKVVFSKAVLLVLFAVCIASASAQLRDFNATGDGRGSWDLRPQWDNADLRQVQVILKRDGTAEIRLSRGVDLVIRGRWSNKNDQRCLLAIEGVGRDAGYGDGTVDHDSRGNLIRLHLAGSVERTRFTLDFSTIPGENQGGSRGPSGGYRSGISNLSSTQDGRGSIRFRGRSSEAEVRKVSVSLRNNGTAEIRLMNGSNETLSGKWVNTGGRTVRITIDRMGRDRASGSGTVDHDGRGNFTRVTLSGDVGGPPFDFNFSPGRYGNGNDNNNGNGGNWSAEERQFLDAARRAVQEKFPMFTKFEWYSETVGGNVLGNRTVKGQFRTTVKEEGEYQYTVTLGAGTANVKSVSYSRN